MTLGLAYLYCTKLTDQEKIDIDKKVRKNRLELKLAVYLPFLPFPFPQPMVPFHPVEGFNPQQIIRNGRDRFDSAVAEKIAQMSRFVDDCDEVYKEFKVYSEMSSTLKKISNKVRKDEETNKSLDNLQEQLKKGEFHAGRGAQKLPGSKNIFYMRAGNKARLFFRYSKDEEKAVEIIAESNKDQEEAVIKNLKKNYD